MTASNRIWKWLTVMMIVAGLGLMSACNTMEGFGKDVERAGEGIEDAAD